MKKIIALLWILAAGSVGLMVRADEGSLLNDKTLVAWVAPANLEQRGGSVLSIDDQQGHFDGIVFGEKASGKWMAGSEGFARTKQDQSSFPLETADAKTLVQIAMVYHGKQITTYRNGVEYSQYEIAGEPQSFGSQSVVIIGKRHLKQSGNGHFAGAIEDARIYDQVLSAEQISALKPKVAAEIKPWAWWMFDGPEAKDYMGRFESSELAGGAKVEAGKLILDGINGGFLAQGKLVFETPAWPANPPSNWLTFHLAHPGPSKGSPFDPNCAIFWKGRYHLFYIYRQDCGFVFGHVSSTDMVHWKWHPTTLTPQVTHHGMFSGTGFFTKEGKPAIIYHGEGSGRNQIAVAEDDQLDKWSKPWKVEPIIGPDQDGSKIGNWDPDAWLDGDTYYALSGGKPSSGKPPTLFKSSDLKTWTYLGLFLDHDMPDVKPTEDVSCPNFFKIGNKYMLLCISHTLGCRYYLGTWKDEKFTPDFHARMTWNGRNRDFFAPESVLTEDGRRVMWAWMMGPIAPMGVQSLPRELSLPEDGVLRIKPLRELESLRFDEKREANLTVKSDATSKPKVSTGDSMELQLTITPGKAQEFGLDVLCTTTGEKGLRIAYEAETKTLRVGQTRAPFALKEGEELNLRVFIDKNLVEVFANDLQAAVGEQNYVEGNTDIRLFSKGGDVVVKEMKSWKLKSIYEESKK